MPDDVGGGRSQSKAETVLSDWTKGYHAALDDFERLATARGYALHAEQRALLADLRQDSLVIKHELDNRKQRVKLRAAREVLT